MLGTALELDDGFTLGMPLGSLHGLDDGVKDGTALGLDDGSSLGMALGSLLGTWLGS